MRSSTVLSVLLVGGALANPVRRHLEERALVIEHKTVTTVVWVTEGAPAPTPEPVAPAAVVPETPQKAAVAPDYKPHRHGHAHGNAGDRAAAQAAAAQKAAEQKAAEEKAAEKKAAEEKAAEEQAAEQPAEPVAEKAPENKAPEPKAPEQKASPPAQSSGASGEVGTEGYKSAVLEHHNIHRSNHSADPLQWDDTLASYAEQVAKKCVYDHDRTPGGGGYGQNIAAGTPATQVAKILTNAFYNDEIEAYPGYDSDSPDMTNFHVWGHFSQMVWSDTTKVGCYSYNCNPAGKVELDCDPSTGASYLGKTGCGNGGMYPVFTVCNYSPPGNYAGQYKKIKAPLGQPTVTVRAHANNPVAWQMWSDESLALAKKHNRLLFLSIGYAACHWCHVMERESFASSEIAQLLNAHFIPIKIDREERPDVDAIYMNYVQATNGSGGWPLNVFVTPDLEPVFGGTYWPGPNHSMAAQNSQTVGFLQILQKMRDVWTNQEARCRESGKEITRQLRQFAEEGVHSRKVGDRSDEDALDIDLLEEAYQHFLKRYDTANGGFSVAPKFPTPVNLQFLLRLDQWANAAVNNIVGEDECKHATRMVVNTLRKMARGGIRDQIGFGFARYSVTKDWSLPHFEKMLYDQAQLLDVYLDAFIVTHDPEMLGAVIDIATYLTEPPMAAASGGFFSAEDADSYPTHADTEKREGAYYVWTLKELRTVLGDRDGNVCAQFYGVLADGNVARENDPHDEFISQNVINVTTTPAALAKQVGLAESEVVAILKEGRKKLRVYREENRPKPALDDKIVVAWNGLAIGALARTSAILVDVDAEKASRFRKAAEDAAEFIRKELFDENSKILYRVYREGRGDTPGFCDDYAFLIHGLIDLYEATFNDSYLEFADILQKSQITSFHDPTSSGFFTTTSHPSLLLHLKSGMDAAEPSSNSISASNLHRLSSLLNDDNYSKLAVETVAAFEAEVMQFPHCFAGMLGSIVMGKIGVQTVVIMGPRETAREKVKEGVGVGRTVAWGGGDWLRARNELVGSISKDKEGVMICAEGACREVESL
ncbi:MAG: hypothetical protein Q9169_004246 [Polycauliona sp. 2 TL-2023]